MEKNEINSELSFEQALVKLEEIVEQLSTGSGSLEELVRQYEIGIKYLNQCRSKLEEAETRINILSKEIPNATNREDNNGF
ncbi:MAG: exodeoxyribonuclease VII small subunit [Candidatus Cloacimonetes bacterium HGW-Cloacimonetes-1]|jgi:exodeoxyribonuclease VII small subunit|nr:MAG: exodeoxyribonuclease VII small subunit [Candidatus Cloacimonetes bacterium HGW-Cloacimonetes-1]